MFDFPGTVLDRCSFISIVILEAVVCPAVELYCVILQHASNVLLNLKLNVLCLFKLMYHYGSICMIK